MLHVELLRSAATSKGRRWCQRDNMAQRDDATANPKLQMGICTGSLPVYTHQLEVPIQKQHIADEWPPFKYPHTPLPAKAVNLSANATFLLSKTAARHNCNVTVLARAGYRKQRMSAAAAGLVPHPFGTGSRSPVESHEPGKMHEALGYQDVQGCQGNSVSGTGSKDKSSESNCLVTESRQHSSNRTSSCQESAFFGGNVAHVPEDSDSSSASSEHGHMEPSTADLEQVLQRVCVLTDEDRAFYGCTKPKNASPQIPSAQAVQPCNATDAQPLKNNSNLAPSAESNARDHLPPWVRPDGEISDCSPAPPVAFGAAQGISSLRLCGFCPIHPQRGCEASSNEVAAALLRYRCVGRSGMVSSWILGSSFDNDWHMFTTVWIMPISWVPVRWMPFMWRDSDLA
jgi:hypothetical protein